MNLKSLFKNDRVVFATWKSQKMIPTCLRQTWLQGWLTQHNVLQRLQINLSGFIGVAQLCKGKATPQSQRDELRLIAEKNDSN